MKITGVFGSISRVKYKEHQVSDRETTAFTFLKRRFASVSKYSSEKKIHW